MHAVTALGVGYLEQFILLLTWCGTWLQIHIYTSQCFMEQTSFIIKMAGDASSQNFEKS